MSTFNKATNFSNSLYKPMLISNSSYYIRTAFNTKLNIGANPSDIL